MVAVVAAVVVHSNLLGSGCARIAPVCTFIHSTPPTHQLIVPPPPPLTPTVWQVCVQVAHGANQGLWVSPELQRNSEFS
jgi:hypothetical protein